MGDQRDRVLDLVEARLRMALGEPTSRAAVTFVGAERIEVLRFSPPRYAARDPDALGANLGIDGSATMPLVCYATLGMSRWAMNDPLAVVADPLRGPRAELLLTLRERRDEVLRSLAVLAASPQVEGLVVAPGASLDVGEPLWPGAPFSAVLVAEPNALIEDLTLESPADPVRFLPLLPMTAQEAAYKRVHGVAALRERWLRHGTDLSAPDRGTVPLAN